MLKSSNKISKTKKKHLKRLKNASERSQSLFHKTRGVTVDEEEHFHQTGELFPPGQNSPDFEKNDVIRLHDPRDGSDLSVICSCGWSYGPDENYIELGRQAVAHSNETQHILRGHE